MTRARQDAFARATSLAFAGRLREATAALNRLPRSAAASEERRWLRSYLLAATGDYARAERSARAVLERAGDPDLRSRAAVTLGSILRQTGRHREARVVETEAVRRAPTATHRAHLFVGLAADAVGLGELEAVDGALSEAAAAASRDPRVAIRIHWVRCERELLAGNATVALRHARRALSAARRAGARRHVAKSHLFAGAAAQAVARAATGGARSRANDEARRSLRSACSIAERIGADPIARIACDLRSASPMAAR